MKVLNRLKVTSATNSSISKLFEDMSNYINIKKSCEVCLGTIGSYKYMNKVATTMKEEVNKEYKRLNEEYKKYKKEIDNSSTYKSMISIYLKDFKPIN